MSGLTLRPLTRREVRRIYRWEMCVAFPRSERRPLRSILAMMDRGEYDALGFYQAGTLEGYACCCAHRADLPTPPPPWKPIGRSTAPGFPRRCTGALYTFPSKRKRGPEHEYPGNRIFL